MYVIAHEYGHHVQQITGVMDQADRTGTGEESDSVRTELQADCYAGLWTGHAATTVDPDTGTTFLEPITDAELADALSAAQAVGDDHIQAQSGGVDPDTWTHGSSEQRQRWFTTGLRAGHARGVRHVRRRRALGRVAPRRVARTLDDRVQRRDVGRESRSARGRELDPRTHTTDAASVMRRRARAPARRRPPSTPGRS